MSNPSSAFKGTVCDGCNEEMTEGEDIFFDDGDKLCAECAEKNGNVCECGQYKKSEFKECYECSRA